MRVNELGEYVDMNATEHFHNRLQLALKSQHLPTNWREVIGAMQIAFRDAKGKKLIENVLAGRSSSLLLIETMESLIAINYRKAGGMAAMPPEIGFSITERLAQANEQSKLKLNEKAA